jgi:hypothetical protein
METKRESTMDYDVQCEEFYEDEMVDFRELEDDQMFLSGEE